MVAVALLVVAILLVAMVVVEVIVVVLIIVKIEVEVVVTSVGVVTGVVIVVIKGLKTVFSLKCKRPDTDQLHNNCRNCSKSVTTTLLFNRPLTSYA